MKTLVTLGLLALLLAHSLGWPLAVLCSGRNAAMRERVEVSAGNAAAWHTFTELSERLVEMDRQKSSPTPWSTALKVAGDLAKNYLPGGSVANERRSSRIAPSITVQFAEVCGVCHTGVLECNTPPPEMIG